MPYLASVLTDACNPNVVCSIPTLFRFDVGVMDAPAGSWSWKKLGTNCTTASSVASARHLSAVSTVLLKNDGGVLPLPLSASSPKSIALIGFAGDGAVVHGGGSGSVVASYTVTPLEGMGSAAGDGAILFYNNGTDVAAAAALAKRCDYAVVFVATLSHEGGDRASLSLDDGCVYGNFELRHHFGPNFTPFSAPPHPTRAETMFYVVPVLVGGLIGGWDRMHVVTNLGLQDPGSERQEGRQPVHRQRRQPERDGQRGRGVERQDHRGGQRAGRDPDAVER